MRHMPAYIHHFSWHSKISLELPIGFEEQDEDPERSEEAWTECTIDGAPAVQQTLVYEQQDLGIQVVRHETFAQLGNIVFSLIFLAPATRTLEYLPAFDHAAHTARFVLL